jgi:hypothetical protein
MRKTTPPCVTGAGVVGIFSGAGVFQYSMIRRARPTTNSSVAA